MEQITAYLLNLLEVLENEGKLLRLSAARTLQSLVCVIAGVFLLGVGVLFLAWTCFSALSALFGPVAAGLAASLLTLAGGGIFLWTGKAKLK